MEFEEKQKIAEIARILIDILQMCDDGNFVDEVVACVNCGDYAGIETYL